MESCVTWTPRKWASKIALIYSKYKWYAPDSANLETRWPFFQTKLICDSLGFKFLNCAFYHKNHNVGPIDAAVVHN